MSKAVNRWAGISLAGCLAVGVQTAGVAATRAPSPSETAQSASSLYLAASLTTRQLQPGNTGADVSALQRLLSSYRLYSGPIDGVYGPQTEAAVANFQRIRGLPETGIADAGTLTAMGFELPLDPAMAGDGRIGAEQLTIGNSGPDVLELQQNLRRLGFAVPLDGYYGSQTAQAIRGFQQIRGLPVSGTADRVTLESMGLEVVPAAAAEAPVDPQNRYIVAVIANDPTTLSEARRYYPNAQLDADRLGEFINLGNYPTRGSAEAAARTARDRGFNTRVLYR